jgi:osmotically-inducible protein OsmY
MLLPLLAFLGALTGCGTSSEEKSSDLVQALQTSAPMLAAEDLLLVAKVRGKLASVDVDTVGNVFVTARAGAVVLRGRARTEPEIAHLSEAASSVTGVKNVSTLLRADPHLRGASEQLSDVALATQVIANLAAQAGVNAFSVRTHAVDGVVTLEGKVPSSAVKSVMWSAAAKTHGVKRVIDKMSIASAA